MRIVENRELSNYKVLPFDLFTENKTKILEAGEVLTPGKLIMLKNYIRIYAEDFLSESDNKSGPKEEQITKKALKYNMPGLAMTDHGNMYGAYKFSEEEIREINRDFRDKDAVTDVISFPLIADEKTGIIAKNLKKYAVASNIDPATKNLNLGDIYICLKRAKEQANEFGHSIDREISFLALHGLLHLMGYDHIDDYDKCVMRLKEEEILSKCGTNIRMEDEVSLKERKLELKRLEKERNKN